MDATEYMTHHLNKDKLSISAKEKTNRYDNKTNKCTNRPTNLKKLITILAYIYVDIYGPNSDGKGCAKNN